MMDVKNYVSKRNDIALSCLVNAGTIYSSDEYDSANTEGTMLVGHLLKIVTSSSKFRKLVRSDGGELQYHRLLFIKDLNGGSVFFVLTDTFSESERLFEVDNLSWIGSLFFIYEPTRIGQYRNSHVMKSSYPLISIESFPLTGNKMYPIVRYSPKDSFSGFSFQTESILMKTVSLIWSCDGAHCNGFHGDSLNCPSLHSQSKCRIMHCKLTVPKSPIVDIEIYPLAMTKLIASERFLSKEEPLTFKDQSNFKEKCRDFINMINDSDIKYHVLGYQRFRINKLGGTYRSELYVTKVEPMGEVNFDMLDFGN